MDILSDKLITFYMRRHGHDYKREILWEKLNDFSIATQKDTIWTNNVNMKIDDMHQNYKCVLCRRRDEMINHIVSECRKLLQKHDRVRK